jgi:spore coat polysaccharide biosynthesis protein SpsF
MIGCIIQARMGSTRLPGKVMEKVDDANIVLDYVINQVKFSKKIEKIIVATTILPEDDVICEYLDSQKICFFRGSSEDVLDRYYQCAKKFSLNNIVRITADNPLIDPNVIDLIVDEYEKNKCDYASNTIHRTFPYGTEVEVFSFESLEKAWNNAKKNSEREHVTPFMYDSQNGFVLINTEYYEDLSHLRYTVDRMEDLKLVKKIIENISKKPILIQDIIELYKNKSEIFKINENIKQN